MPRDWQTDYCSVAEVYACTLDGPQIIQFVVTAAGPSAVNATLALNNTITALSDSRGNVHARNGLATTSLTPSNAAVVLPQGCHKVSLTFQDPANLSSSNQVRMFYMLLAMDMHAPQTEGICFGMLERRHHIRAKQMSFTEARKLDAL
jgi:hypothetical protein